MMVCREVWSAKGIMGNADGKAATHAHQTEHRRFQQLPEALRSEKTAGILMVLAAAIALVWANSMWSGGYFALRDFHIGYAPWGLDLSVGEWASDGLLAIFFFLVGLELKQEIIAGDLRNPRTAAMPIMAAIGGVIVPAVVYVAVIAIGAPTEIGSLAHGWATPTATDITFAVAILALLAPNLPSGLRLFLLTLAVVDDLIAVVIIALFYTDGIRPVPLLASLLVLGVYWLIAHQHQNLLGLRPFAAWVILFPIGLVCWAFVHASGIHATIAGVALGLCVPVRPGKGGRRGWGEDGSGLAGEFEYRFRPLSNVVAVPVFALFAAGVALGGRGGAVDAFAAPVTVAVITALVVGKPFGIIAATWATAKASGSRLPAGAHWVDLAGIAMLGGVGFTVALLVAELSFPAPSPEAAHAKIAVLTASLLAAVLASLILIPRNRHFRAHQ